ncbi:MAG TPA: WhiB family transcriptional regulator [Acidimicrobiia bacterium]|nr:WhiB family transcriptional regulator [Acidimicrobiia bacterium]
MPDVELPDMPDDASWMAQARCRGTSPGEFFPSESKGVIAAQRMCAECPVAKECLEYALEHRIEQGVWGGKSERQRRLILRKRRAILRQLV